MATFFRYPEYIRAVGGQLTPFNVLDYFSKSDFYEPSCNNAVLQMQSAASNLPPPPAGTMQGGAGAEANAALAAWERRNDPLVIEQELRRFVGLEFVVVHAKPPDLFVIHKRWRTGPTQTKVLDVYYILQGNVTMAADLYTILGSRLLSTVSALESSLSLARNAQPDFNPREGHAWRIAAETQPDDEEDEDEEEQGSSETLGKDHAEPAASTAGPAAE